MKISTSQKIPKLLIINLQLTINKLIFQLKKIK